MFTASEVFTNGPVKCPGCREFPVQKVPGYILGTKENGERWIKRCEVCKGWGFCTMVRALDYRAGLARVF